MCKHWPYIWCEGSKYLIMLALLHTSMFGISVLVCEVFHSLLKWVWYVV